MVVQAHELLHRLALHLKTVARHQSVALVGQGLNLEHASKRHLTLEYAIEHLLEREALHIETVL